MNKPLATGKFSVSLVLVQDHERRVELAKMSFNAVMSSSNEHRLITHEQQPDRHYQLALEELRQHLANEEALLTRVKATGR